MKPKKPSIFKMVQSFVKESVEFVKKGAPVCSKEEYQERISICMSCEHFTEKQKCGLCGCNMQVKTGWKTSECADNPPRWNKLVLSDKEQQLLDDAAEAEKKALLEDTAEKQKRMEVAQKTSKEKEILDKIERGERSFATLKMHTAGWSKQDYNEEVHRLLKEEDDTDMSPEELADIELGKHEAALRSQLEFREKKLLERKKLDDDYKNASKK